MLGINELNSLIEEFNAKEQKLKAEEEEAKKEEVARQFKFINDFKDVKNNEIKPNISELVQCLNKAIGIKANVNYVQKDLETIGNFEGIEIEIVREDNSNLSVKISPNIFKETVICSVDRNPGFGDDKKFEMQLKDFNNTWLNDFVISEFKKFIS